MFAQLLLLVLILAFTQSNSPAMLLPELPTTTMDNPTFQNEEIQFRTKQIQELDALVLFELGEVGKNLGACETMFDP